MHFSRIPTNDCTDTVTNNLRILLLFSMDMNTEKLIEVSGMRLLNHSFEVIVGINGLLHRIDIVAGKNCQIDVDECETTPCYNGGTCFDRIASVECKCPTGFTGNRCEIDIDDCQVSFSSYSLYSSSTLLPAILSHVKRRAVLLYSEIEL